MELKSIGLLVLALVAIIFLLNFAKTNDLDEQSLLSFTNEGLDSCESRRTNWLEDGSPCVTDCLLGTTEVRNCISANCGYSSALVDMFAPLNKYSVFEDDTYDCSFEKYGIYDSCWYQCYDEFWVMPCIEEWHCSEWGMCVNGVQTRTCTDYNECGTTAEKPDISNICLVGGGDEFVCDSNADGLINRDELGSTIQKWVGQ